MRRAKSSMYTPRASFSSSRRRRRLYFVSIVFSSLLFCCFLYFIFASSLNPVNYSVIIDAGSAGSRIHVIAYRHNKSVMIDFDVTDSKKSTPGLSSYSSDPDKAGESLINLIDFTKKMIKKDNWGKTEIRLMATSGLRLLQNDIKEQILDSCRQVLENSPFIFHHNWAAVISVEDEGIYAWVAANYALGTLGADPKYTTGIFELGDASQVTFVTSEALPQEFSYFLKFGDFKYNLYCYSFLHLGQNVTYDSLHDLLSGKSLEKGIYGDPSAPKGFLQGTKSSKILNSYATGNFSECRSAALSLLKKGKENCVCHLGDAFIHELKGRFLATENFYYSSKVIFNYMLRLQTTSQTGKFFVLRLHPR